MGSYTIILNTLRRRTRRRSFFGGGGAGGGGVGGAVSLHWSRSALQIAPVTAEADKFPLISPPCIWDGIVSLRPRLRSPMATLAGGRKKKGLLGSKSFRRPQKTGEGSEKLARADWRQKGRYGKINGGVGFERSRCQLGDRPLPHHHPQPPSATCTPKTLQWAPIYKHAEGRTALGGGIAVLIHHSQSIST